MAKKKITYKTLTVKNIISTTVMLSSLFGLAVLGWFAYEEGRNPPDISMLPLVTANSEPFKVEPDDPGGMQIPNADSTIYNVISSMKEPIDIVELLQKPEEPTVKTEIERHKKASLLPEKNNIKKTAIRLYEIPNKPLRKKVEKYPKMIRGKASKKSWVQLGSYRSRKMASEGWKTLKKRFSRELGNLQHDIAVINLGKKGIFYRLYAGAFSNSKISKELCKKLVSKKQGCLVAKR